MDIWRNWVVWVFVLIFVLILLWFFAGGESLSPDYEGAIPGFLYKQKEEPVTSALPPIEMPSDFSLPEVSNIPLSESFIFQTRTSESDSEDSEDEEPPAPPPKSRRKQAEVRPTSPPSHKVQPTQQYQVVNLHPHQFSGGAPGKPRKISHGEKELGDALLAITGRKFANQVRPDFLRSPESGRNLELDWYDSELEIAAEFNGIQHYEWPNFTSQTEAEFINQHRRDAHKLKVCNGRGIYLLVVPYHYEGKIESFVRSLLTEDMWARIRRGHV